MSTKKVICSVCGIEFERDLRRANEAEKNNWKQFCSKDCRSHRNSKKLNCSHCGKEIWRTESQIARSKSGNVFCNRSCATSFNNKHYKVGENHPNYISGTKSYRKKALQNYKKECEICGWSEDERVLEVHHIDSNRKNNDISNLALLCPTCHRKITLNYSTFIRK